MTVRTLSPVSDMLSFFTHAQKFASQALANKSPATTASTYSNLTSNEGRNQHDSWSVSVRA